MITCKYFPKKTLGCITDDLWYLGGIVHQMLVSLVSALNMRFWNRIIWKSELSNKCLTNIVKWCFAEIIDFVA